MDTGSDLLILRLLLANLGQFLSSDLHDLHFLPNNGFILSRLNLRLPALLSDLITVSVCLGPARRP